jgi:predicted nucleic acid-binding protein
VPTVLCDSGPLIALAKINRLQLLLDLWGTVQITETVYQEAVVFGQAQGAPDALTKGDRECIDGNSAEGWPWPAGA